LHFFNKNEAENVSIEKYREIKNSKKNRFLRYNILAKKGKDP